MYISTIVFEIGRAGREADPVPLVQLAQVAGLHVEVERPLAPAGLDARHPLHLGRGFEVLEIVGLVDEEVIDPKLVEDQAVVFLVLGEELLQPLLPPGLLLLDGLDDVPVGTVRGLGAVHEELVVLGDLLPQELRLVLAATSRFARTSCA